MYKFVPPSLCKVVCSIVKVKYKWHLGKSPLLSLLEALECLWLSYLVTVMSMHGVDRPSSLCVLVQVSATFAASFVISPAIGAYLSSQVGDGTVVLLASIIALIDLVFIWLVVPESLPERMRPAMWGAPISWEQADPFAVHCLYN